MEQTGRANIPIRLKNVTNPAGLGTIIYPSQSSGTSTPIFAPDMTQEGVTQELSMPRAIFMRSNGYHGEEQYRRTPTAVTTKDSIVIFTIHSTGKSVELDFVGRISTRLAHHGFTINLISGSRKSLSVAVSRQISDVHNELIERTVQDLEEIGIVTVARHMSIVSVVGHKMRNMVGIAGTSPQW